MQDRNEHLQIILKNFHLYTLLFLCVYMHALFVCVYERERLGGGDIVLGHRHEHMSMCLK